MKEETTRVDYVLAVDTKDIDKALKKTKLLNAEVERRNKLSKIADREKRTSLYGQSIVNRHEENKYKAITARQLAKSKIRSAYIKAENDAKKISIMEDKVASQYAFKYDKLSSDEKLKNRNLDIKEYATLEKIENEKKKTAIKERESIDKANAINEKASNIRLETARKERESIEKLKFAREKEANKSLDLDKKIQSREKITKHNNILKARRLKYQEKSLEIKEKKLLMQERQQERLARMQKRAGRGSRRPFESIMMMIGSFMLLQYAVQMPFLWASSLGDAMANIEMDTRKGNAYRNSLIGKGVSTKNFDESVSRYSEMSGEQGYMARARMAKIYGQLGQSGINASNLNPEAIANVLQGLTAGMGMSDEQADKKLAEILANRISKEDKKMFGIKSRTPVQILEEMNTSFKNNPVIASTLRTESATSHMKFIRGAKNELFSQIDDLWGNLFTSITGPMKEFTKTFFGLDNERVKGEWITMLSTIRDQVEKVFTKENAEKIAVFFNRVVSAISMLVGSIAKFTLDHPWLTGGLVSLGLYNKSRTGSVFGFGGDGKNDPSVRRVYVTNMPEGIGESSSTANAAKTAIIIGALKAVSPYLAAAIGAVILGPLAVHFGKKWWNDTKDNNAADGQMRFAGLSYKDRYRYKQLLEGGKAPSVE